MEPEMPNTGLAGIRLGAGVAVALVVLLCSSVSPGQAARGQVWVARANAVCSVWAKRGDALAGGPARPVTAKTMFEFMEKAEPIEAGELRAVRRIPGVRPKGANDALALADADVRELKAGIAAFKAADTSTFLDAWNKWISDDRASKRFIALGARACA